MKLLIKTLATEGLVAEYAKDYVPQLDSFIVTELDIWRVTRLVYGLEADECFVIVEKASGEDLVS